MEPFTVVVEEVYRKEYIQASRQMTMRLYRILAIAMILVCGIIILASGQFNAPTVLTPVGIYLAVVVVAEVWVQLSYRDTMTHLDNLYYDFAPLRWAIVSGTERSEFDWVATPKLKKTRDCLFLYSEESRSNLVPRRLLTPEQEAQILKWYADTRLLAKEYQRQQRAKERARRQGSSGRYFQNRGPSWGPFKKNNRRW